MRYLIFAIALFSVACNIDKKDLTVIEGITLGVTKKQYNKQLDSLNLNVENFYTRMIMDDLSQVENNKIGFYYTKLFDNPKYGHSELQHLGLLYPTTLNGTENIVGVNVLLGHTGQAQYFSKLGVVNLSKDNGTKQFEQSITFNQIDEIESMLIEKYGKPKDKTRSQYFKFYVMEGNQVNSYNSDTSNIGEMVTWETKYIDINLYKGIFSPNSVYSSNDKGYTYNFESNPFREIDYEKGEQRCVSYAYIGYTLNTETMKKLKLDVTKL